MDILTHTLSGVAVGTVVASFDTSGIKNKAKIILISGFAGALPDLDAISMWSGFDNTIGSFFDLPAKGREIYSAKYWYSHHAFLHSAFAAFIIAFLWSLFFFLKDFIVKKKKGYLNSLRENYLLLIGFFFGFIIHLLEDMPTPSSSWGGVNFFWPSQSYIGGTGDIWWWNNYDIFLIVLTVIITNIFVLLLQKFISMAANKITVMVFILGLAAAFYQIKTRGFDFAYSGHTSKYQEYEIKSKEIQKEILGERVYSIMEKFDNKLRIYF